MKLTNDDSAQTGGVLWDLGLHNKAYDLFIANGSILVGPAHYLIQSGRHCEIRVNLGKLSDSQLDQIAQLLNTLCVEFEFDLVAGKTRGGALIARAIAGMRNVDCVILERDETAGHGLALAHPAKMKVMGRRVLAVDDVVFNPINSTLFRAVQTLRDAEAIVPFAATMFSPSHITAYDIGVTRLASLVCLEVKIWTPDACRVKGPCSRRVPLDETTIYHRPR